MSSPTSSRADRRAVAATAAIPVAARRHPLVTEVADTLAGPCGVPLDGPATRPLVIAVSGGPDSLALLLAACVLRDRRGSGVGPVATHVHHHLRGAEADGDAEAVADACRRLDVELHVEHVHPADRPGNLADQARRLRYAALTRVARRVDATAVAVGHHADDQLETILIALGRGTGLDGLAGMPWQRSLEPGVTLVRPLLGARHAQCVDLCAAASITPRQDSSNLDPRGLRARLRRDLIPQLESQWPDVARHAAAVANDVDAARAALARQLDDAFGPATCRRWPRPRLATLAPPIVAAGLRRATLALAPQLADRLGRRHLASAAAIITGDGGGGHPRRLDWPGGLRLEIDARVVRLVHPDERDGTTRSAPAI